jgi:uncharacterized protein YndB with AHSA1/START domain
MDNSTVPANFLLSVRKEIQIDAPAAIVFESVLDQCGPGFAGMDGKSMNLALEAWPGGRWFRDLGNKTGHLWGHVQVIKPPTLLELTGPMFMSYPVISHVQYRLTENSGKTTLTLTHRAIGDIAPEHREGVGKGWDHILSKIKDLSKR